MIWQAVHAGFGYFQREAGLHPHRLPRHPRPRPRDRPVARGRPGRGALAAAHLPRRRHAAARPLPDRPRRQDDDRREMARPGLAGLQRAHRRGRRDRLPAPRRSPHPKVRPGMDRPRRRPRVRDQGHQRPDDAPVLLPARIDHRRPARPRGSIRAAVWPRAIPARTRAPRASLELQDAQPQARRAGSRAGARGLGGQAHAHPRRAAGVDRAIGVARSRTRNHARRNLTWPGPDRGRADARGPEGGRAGPAGKVRVDARRRDQAPGPGAAPHRDEPGRGRRAPGGPNGPGARLPVRAGGLPGGARAARGSGEHAARGRPQHLPAARRRPVRDARAARHGGAHARASPRGHRAEAGARAGRARARRRPGASRERTHRRRARHTRAAHGDRAARGPGRRRARGTHRRPARIGDQRPGRIRQDPRPGRGRPHLGRSRPGPGNRRSPRPSPPATPWPPGSRCPTTPPSSSATCPAAAAPAALSPSAPAPFSSSTRPRCCPARTWPT